MGNSTFSFLGARQNVHAVGTKDGVNATFSLPGGEAYVQASLEVYLNGQLVSPDAVTKNGPGYTTFTINDTDLPISTDTLTVSYLVDS